jgi:thiol:disulfide interchange protein DsbG
MTEHEALLMSRKGGLPVPDKVDEAQLAKVKANTDLLQKLGADSVPFIVYRNAKSGVYGSHTGGMSTEQLAEMVGA